MNMKGKEMPGPQCKIYFTDEAEYHTVLRYAAAHKMTLPEYVRNSVVEITNGVIQRELAEAEAIVTAAKERVTQGVTKDGDNFVYGGIVYKEEKDATSKLAADVQLLPPEAPSGEDAQAGAE